MSDPYIFNIQMLQSQLSTANREITRLRARVAELEAAINPLASLPLWPEEFAAMGDRDLTIGEIRAARAALKDTTHEPSA